MQFDLDHEPAVIVQQVLVQLGLGKLPSDATLGHDDWPIFAPTEPDRPDCAVTVQETVGRDDGRDMLDGGKDGTYGLQIRVRGNNRARAKFKASQIVSTITARSLCYFDKPACWVNLDPLTGTVEAQYVLQMFVRIGNPLWIGADVPGGKRQVFTINCEARIIQQA